MTLSPTKHFASAFAAIICAVAFVGTSVAPAIAPYSSLVA